MWELKDTTNPCERVILFIKNFQLSSICSIYTRQVYEDAILDGYLEALCTEEGKALLDCYGLSDQERKIWKIGFPERLDADLAKMIESELSAEEREKLERNKRLFG